MLLVLYVLYTDVLKGDPLGLLDITDEVIIHYVSSETPANNQLKSSFK